MMAGLVQSKRISLSRLSTIILLALLAIVNFRSRELGLITKQITEIAIDGLVKDYGMNINGADKTFSSQCMGLEFNKSIDSLIANTRQIFITMPAKAGGSSMKFFSTKCNRKKIDDNFLNDEEAMKEFLVDTLHVPSVVSSHLYDDKPLIRLSKYPSRQNLIIYVHRQESDRLVSAVNQVLRSLCKFAVPPFLNAEETTKKFNVQKNDTHCVLNEGPVVNEIKARTREIRFGSSDILTCELYNALQENAPQLIFLHYKRLDKLQMLLAKHHCAYLLNELPIKLNAIGSKKSNVFLRNVKKGGGVSSTVALEDWLHEKSDALEWALGLKSKASCQAKTVGMETELFGCDDEVMRVTSASIDAW